MNIDRRNALAGIAAMFGTALFAPIARAAEAGALPRADDPPSAPVFTDDQRALVKQLSERILPATDTPGAVEAGVPEFIEKLLADWSMPDDRKPILAGLDAIEARSQADYQVAAIKATAEQQDALLTLAMDGKFPGGGAFFGAFRQMVITGYFTSEIGILQERDYVPVPGRYDGAQPYKPGTKVYSS